MRGLDLVGPLQKAPGSYTHLLVAIDKFSKWIEVRPLNSIRSEQAVAGGQEQRSRRQPSLHPIRGQRESPLSRREDDTPVFHSSNGSRTRNGCPANRTPRRINSATGQAAPLAREASDASPSP
jgi:hypothetical protein